MYIRLWRWLRQRFSAKLHSLTNMNGGLQSDNCSGCIQACKWGPQRAIWNKAIYPLDVMSYSQAPTLCRHLLPQPQDRTWNLICHPGDEGSTTKSSSECFNEMSHISLCAPQSKLAPFSKFFSSGNRKGSQEVRSDELGGCSHTVMCSWAKNDNITDINW